MDLLQILPLLGLGGIIGGIIGAYFQTHFQHKKQIKELEHDLKRQRYLCINVLLLYKIDSKRGLVKLRNTRPDITNERDLDEEILSEFLNAYLFASNDVINSLIAFRGTPDYDNYYKVVKAMRQDLWGRKVKFDWEVTVVKD